MTEVTENDEIMANLIFAIATDYNLMDEYMDKTGGDVDYGRAEKAIFKMYGMPRENTVMRDGSPFCSDYWSDLFLRIKTQEDAMAAVMELKTICDSEDMKPAEPLHIMTSAEYETWYWSQPNMVEQGIEEGHIEVPTVCSGVFNTGLEDTLH